MKWLKRALAEISKQISNIPIEKLLPSREFTAQVQEPDWQSTRAPQADCLVEHNDPLISAYTIGISELLENAEAELGIINTGPLSPELSNFVSEASARGSLEFEPFEDLEETDYN